MGSMKSGPVLKTRTRRPLRAAWRARAATTVVLPCPDAGAEMSSAGTQAVIATVPPSQLDPTLRAHSGLKGVLHHAHVRDRIGRLDELRRSAATGDHDVLRVRA